MNRDFTPRDIIFCLPLILIASLAGKIFFSVLEPKHTSRVEKSEQIEYLTNHSEIK